MALLPYTERHWSAFFTITGRQDLLDEFDIGNRQERNARLYSELRQITYTKTTAEWIAICEEIDVPCTPIYAIDALPSHPPLQAVRLFEEVEHPTEGRIRQIRPTTRFSRTPLQIRRHAPTLGEHTEEVLAEAGISVKAEGQ